MRFNDGETNRQPHAHTAAFGAKKAPDIFDRVRGETDAGVWHGDPDVIRVGPLRWDDQLPWPVCLPAQNTAYRGEKGRVRERPFEENATL